MLGRHYCYNSNTPPIDLPIQSNLTIPNEFFEEINKLIVKLI